jgi:hypothetical protein
MASFIILSEAILHLQDKIKSILIGSYMKVVQDCRTKCVNRVRSTVRQLYSSGNTDEGDALWDQCMQQGDAQALSEHFSSSSNE